MSTKKTQLLKTLEVGDRGYVTGLGEDSTFTVEAISPGGVTVRYSKRRQDIDFETLDDEGQPNPVKFTRPAKGILISGTTTVTKL